jgi:hypothetical protein
MTLYDNDIITLRGYSLRVEFPYDEDAGTPWEDDEFTGTPWEDDEFTGTPWEDDEFTGTPWEDDEFTGIVSDWVSRDKRSGERLLSVDGRSRRFYDFAGSVKKAKQQGWGISDDAKAQLAKLLGRAPTAAEIVVEAVERNYQYLRGWCNNDWCYVGVTVSLLNEAGEVVNEDSLWRVESDDGYRATIAHELAEQLVRDAEEQAAAAVREAVREAEERRYWESRDVVTEGT